jgi:hypothetical protein
MRPDNPVERSGRSARSVEPAGASGRREEMRGRCRPSGKFPMRVAGLRDPAHGCLENRGLELEMNTEPRTEVRVAIGDHVDAVDGRDRLDILQAIERLAHRTVATGRSCEAAWPSEHET